MFLGLKTTQDAKFYAISAKFDSFSNEGKALVVQFTVKHEQKIDCGGGYVKVSQQGTQFVGRVRRVQSLAILEGYF